LKIFLKISTKNSNDFLTFQKSFSFFKTFILKVMLKESKQIIYTNIPFNLAEDVERAGVMIFIYYS